MLITDREGASSHMGRISLIVPVAPRHTVSRQRLDSYRRVLLEQGGFESVEVILAGQVHAIDPSAEEQPLTRVLATETARVGALRAGMREASGEYLVVLDPRRSYPPEALLKVIEPIRSRAADLAVATPGRHLDRTGSAIARAGLGLAGRLILGTSDVLSGLIALRRPELDHEIGQSGERGSKLVLDLLGRANGRCVDVPVTADTDDRARPGGFHLDDMRLLKRVVDRRFGTMSRLVQFCVVGASGMMVDLSLYALFQWLFSHLWVLPRAGVPSGFSMPLAVAGALSIFVALVWNFTLNRRLTFNDSRGGSILRQFVTYALGNALGIAVSLFLRLYLPGHFRFFAQHRLAAAVVGIVVATGISFSMSRWVVFRRRGDASTAVPQPHLRVDAALQEPVAVS